MRLRQRNISLDLSGTQRITMVLDASESAAECRQRIARLAEQLVDLLPGGSCSEIYFLGNGRPYPARQLAAQSATWFVENRLRASLIAPVFNTLDPTPGATILVIGSGPVFDLEDWVGTPRAGHVLLVSLGESLQGGLALAEEVHDPEPPQLAAKVHDPVVEVTITADGFMPVWWDNPGYQLQLGEDQIVLAGRQPERCEIDIRCLMAADVDLQVVAHRASGQQTTESVSDTSPATPAASAGGVLTVEESKIFRRAAAGKSFCCLHCGQNHDWDTLRCRQRTRILGELVYPTLRENDAQGFVLFRDRRGRVEFEWNQGTVLDLQKGAVAVQQGRRGVIYKFDASQARWQLTDALMKPYQVIADGSYAILI